MKASPPARTMERSVMYSLPHCLPDGSAGIPQGRGDCVHRTVWRL